MDRFITRFLWIAPIIYGILYFYFGERISLNHGVGWDGRMYADMLRKHIGTYPIDDYSIHRALPSLSLYIFSKLTGVSFNTPTEIANGFYWLNIFCFSLSCFFWTSICEIQKHSFLVFGIGACCILLNYNFLKWITYDPVLTDSEALLLGFAFIYAHLSNSMGILFIATIASAFTWPTCLFFGLLLAFTYKKEHEFPTLILNTATKAAPYCVVFCYLLCVTYLCTENKFSFPTFLCPVSFQLLPISVILSSAILFFGVRKAPLPTIINSLHPASVFSNKRFYVMACAIATSCLITHLIKVHYHIGDFRTHLPSKHHLPTPIKKVLGPAIWYITFFLATGLGKPLVYLVAHFTFMGPFVFLCIWLYSKIIHEVTNIQAGFALCLLASLLLIFDGETRHLAFNIPLFIFGLCSVLQKESWLTKQFFAAFAGLSFLISKAYLPIHLSSFDGNELTFPMQRLFMNFGPWMAWPAFLINATIFLVCSTLLYRLAKMRKSPL